MKRRTLPVPTKQFKTWERTDSLKLYLLYFFLLLSAAQEMVAQEDSIAQRLIQMETTEDLVPIEFDDTHLEEYRQQDAYNYQENTEEDSWWVRFKKWLNHKYNQFVSWLFGSYDANGLLAFFIRIFPYLIILAVLALIIWLFTRLNPGAKILARPGVSKVLLTEEEELVKNEDLHSLIKQAVLEENYRFAVRYQYLLSLKLLDEHRFIQYEFQKTNKEYLQEISETHLQQLFAEVTKFYEFIWYGNFDVSSADYRIAANGFSKIENELKPLKNA